MITFAELYEVLRKYPHTHFLSQLQANLLELDLIMLFSGDACDPECLKLLARFLTLDIYNDLQDERTIKKRCGYLCCDQAPERTNSGNMLRVLLANTHAVNKVSYKPSSLTPYSYLNNYCSKRHYQCSMFYKAQLRERALFSRKDLFLTPGGEYLTPQNYIQLVQAPYAQYSENGVEKSTDRIILLEEVWAYQARTNQASLVDVLAQMNMGTESEVQDTGRDVFPKELMQEVVERFPQHSEDVEMDGGYEGEADDLMVSLEKRAKRIEGYSTEF